LTPEAATTTPRSAGPDDAPADAPSVEFRAVTKRYPGADEAAVDSLDLVVEGGEICVLVGPSGSGKTTAMRMVNRMVEITEGEILIGGMSVRERSPAQLRREIGYVIQQIGLFPHRTVADNVATVPRLLGWDHKTVDARVRELIPLVQLDPDLADRFPAQLSGGQQQRVGVARALAANPGVMLMDEPFGAVDPINRERLQNEFLRLQAELRKTILFVTHDIDEAIKMGDRIAILREGGHLAQYATPAELLMAPADAFVADFVGADRALKRLSLLRVADVDLWKAPLAFVGQATAEARAKLDEAEVPYVLVVDSERRPQGWLSRDELAGEFVPERPKHSPDPIVDRDDVLRDALSDLLQAETLYAPVVDHQGRIAGVLSVEIVSDFLTSEEALTDEHPAAERPVT
jgi:osmoprotectant transport system ATP-binding protein